MSARIDAGEDMRPLAELARQLGVSRQRVHQLLQEKRIPGARRRGRNWFVPVAVILGMRIARGNLDEVPTTTENAPGWTAERATSERPRRKAAIHDNNDNA